MAAFPNLNPSSRTYTPGQYPNTPFKAWSGNEGRVRHSNVMLASQLRVTFVGITEATMLSILSHYNTQRGGFTSFQIPDDLLSGVNTPADYTLTDYLWRYSQPPIVEDYTCGGHTVEVTLESVPPEGATVNGLNTIVPFTLVAGAAAAANGLQLTITSSLTPGSAGVQPAGITATITASLTAGTASGT